MGDIAGSMISAWFVIYVENALAMDQYVFRLADRIELLVNFVVVAQETRVVLNVVLAEDVPGKMAL